MSRIILIGCGKTKLAVSCAASELYCGSLFRKRLRFAEESGEEFLILSAKHGLIDPASIVAPYDQSIGDKSALDQIAWAVGVVGQLCEFIDNDQMSFAELRKVHCEIHAGADYAERLVDVLIAAGFSASWPVRGLSQGEQMRWYSDRERQVLEEISDEA